MMRGHFAYYGVGGNIRRLRGFAHQVGRIWRKWLSRRDRQSVVTWTRFNELLKRHPLPPAKIAHGYAAASESLLVKNRMREFRSSGSARDGGGNVPIYSALMGWTAPRASSSYQDGRYRSTVEGKPSMGTRLSRDELDQIGERAVQPRLHELRLADATECPQYEVGRLSGRRRLL